MNRSWLSYVIWFCVVAGVPSTVCAQRGSASLHGSVSKTVRLSLSPNASTERAEVIAFENGGVLSVTVSSSGVERNLQVPILIRSNTSYNIIASVQSQTAVLTQLRVRSVEAGGKLVAGYAVTGVVIRRQFDMPRRDPFAAEENLTGIDASVPFTIFSGPRISLGGGLDSPDNALKVILLLSVRPNAEQRSWTINLKLQGSGTDTP
jgi:hypothetical protein